MNCSASFRVNQERRALQRLCEFCLSLCSSSSHLLSLLFLFLLRPVLILRICAQQVVRCRSVIVSVIRHRVDDNLCGVPHVLHHLPEDLRLQHRGRGHRHKLRRLRVAPAGDPRVREDLLNVRSLAGVHDQHRADEVLALRRHVVRHDVTRVDDLLEQFWEALAVEWQLPAHEDIQQNPHAPAVHLRPHVLVLLDKLG